MAGGTSRLINLSSRATLTGASAALVPGIILTGSRRLLVRAAGPALAGFGLADALADPVMTLLDNRGTTIATNDDWGTALTTAAPILSADSTLLAAYFAAAGAFTFSAGSKDTAVIVDLPAGCFTIQVASATGAGGTTLVKSTMSPA